MDKYLIRGIKSSAYVMRDTTKGSRRGWPIRKHTREQLALDVFNDIFNRGNSNQDDFL